MGNTLTSLFGGGYKAPDPVQPTPLPAREESPEEAGTRDTERRKLRARAGGVRSTLLQPSATNNLLGISQQ